jgi:hypothetical protein
VSATAEREKKGGGDGGGLMNESQEKGAHSHSVFRLSVSFFCFLL